MKRRPLRAMSGLKLCAVCICLVTIVLQILTTPSPAFIPSFLATLVDWNRLTFTSESPETFSIDLQLYNLSVQRVWYVNDSVTTKEESQIQSPHSTVGVCKLLTDFLTISTSRRHSEQVSSVVVTWDDHPLATYARANKTRLETEKSKQSPVDSMVESYSYEVQIWVTGWGLDDLWNAVNRNVISFDPFLVLGDLPLEREMGFRVRMKTQQTKMSILGLMLPIGFFSTETDGEWSEVVFLSPTRDDELQAIVTSLVDNKLLGFLLAVCIGSSCLVVIQLYIRPVFEMQSFRFAPGNRQRGANEASCDSTDKSTQELEHEIHDLRQELADSEDEVRQLLLLSGCGIETLSSHELEQLERELRYTLKRIQYLKKNGLTRTETRNNVDKQVSVSEPSQQGRWQLRKRDDSFLSPIYEHRTF